MQFPAPVAGGSSPHAASRCAPTILALCAALGAARLALRLRLEGAPRRRHRGPTCSHARGHAAPADVAPVTAAEVTRTWTPEALEELLAPVALYPDPVLSQLLIASTNPQEVLDAGNWLLQNTSLKGKALDDAAASDRLHAAGPRAACSSRRPWT